MTVTIEMPGEVFIASIRTNIRAARNVRLWLALVEVFMVMHSAQYADISPDQHAVLVGTVGAVAWSIRVVADLARAFVHHRTLRELA